MEVFFWIALIVMAIVVIGFIIYIKSLVATILNNEREIKALRGDVHTLFNFIHKKFPETDPKRNLGKLYGEEFKN